MRVAVENLQTRDMSQKANVIEALEAISARWQDIVKPLMRLWEDESVSVAGLSWDRLLQDDDDWIRECAAFAKSFGEMNMDTVDTLSLMDRILFFKKVPLLADLSPLDLKQVASLAEEVVFSDGDLLAEEGELGDEMFIIVSGEVKVCVEKDGVRTEVVRRKPGEYVGELSVVNREPRIATLIASGDVRTLCIDRKSFEGLMREKPEVSLAVIRVLSKRLKEATKN
jgi:CRP/FNR family transcriptional regulator